MRMANFNTLLGDLTRTCKDLEEIKAEQTKDHERVSKSFEKTLLSILQQEQSILNQVEEEHGRLRNQLSAIKRANELALQEGVSEINNMVHKISVISSQLKQALGMSTDRESIMEEIKERVSNIFMRKKSINISLRKVHFTPHSFLSSTLGEIQCEEQALGFSLPCLKRKGQRVWSKAEAVNPVFLSDEKPPWEDVTEITEDAGHVGVRIIMEDDSDLETGFSNTLPDLGGEKGSAVPEQKNTISLREQAVEEADNAALSPRTATKIWISDIKNSPSSRSRPPGMRGRMIQSVSAGEGSKAPKPRLTTTKPLHEESPAEVKTSCQVVNSNSVGRDTAHTKSSMLKHTRKTQVFPTTSSQQASHSPSTSSIDDSNFNSTGIKSKVVPLESISLNSGKNLTTTTDLQQTTRTGLKEIIAAHDTRIASTHSHNSVTEKQINHDLCFLETKVISGGHLPIRISDHDTLFRATAAYVFDEDSENSDGTLEEGGGDREEKDPKACRAVALRESRVPSARKNGGMEQITRWMSMESTIQADGNSEDQTSRSYLNIQDNHTCADHSTDNRMALPLAIDYMRMSDKRPDRMSSDGFYLSSRSTSPNESVKSSYTFIIESPRKREVGVHSREPRSFSTLAAKENRTAYPVITAADETSEVKCSLQGPKLKKQTRLQSGVNHCGNPSRNVASNIAMQPSQSTPTRKSVPRSTSMPYIEKIFRQVKAPSRPLRPTSATERSDSASSMSGCLSNPRNFITSAPSGASREPKVRGIPSQYRRRPSSGFSQRLTHQVRSLSKSESNLTDCLLDEGGGPDKLVRQFSKFGSGRAGLNLPHGIHATTTGSLYVVDYGNRRLQVMDARGRILQQITLETKNYFDVAVSTRGLVALTNSTDRTVEVYSKHGRLLHVISRNWGAPRGITTNYRDEFIVADMRLGTICALTLNSSTGHQMESTIVPGFNKPYLVGTNSQGLMAISERGIDGGCCVKVLREDWQLLRVLGLKNSPGPPLFNPWGVCIDSEGGVLVADWAQTHSIIYYPAKRPAQIIVTEGLSSPRGLALWQDCLLLVADSMHNCIKVFQYK